MSATPRQFPVIYKNVRRALLRRFPYALMFVIEADETLDCHRLLPRQPRSGALAKAGVNHPPLAPPSPNRPPPLQAASKI
jgi:hypothetical protein